MAVVICINKKMATEENASPITHKILIYSYMREQEKLGQPDLMEKELLTVIYVGSMAARRYTQT
jgi:hypothetical protein